VKIRARSSTVARARRRPTGPAAAATALALAALTSCGTVPDVPGPSASVTGPGPSAAVPGPSASDAAPSPSAAPTPSAAPASAEVPDVLGRTTTVTVTLAAEAPRAVLADGAVVVEGSLADDAELHVRVDRARWASFPDGSATLTDDDAPGGTAVGGTRPSARDAVGPRRVSTSTRDDGRTLVVTVAPRPGTAAAPEARLPATVTLSVFPRALVSATWADDVEGGRSLQVDPTGFGRSGSTAALEAVRAELAAAEPEAASTVMDHQLRCHALGAPGKPTWNLEPWRPDVDYLDYLLARCNPT